MLGPYDLDNSFLHYKAQLHAIKIFQDSLPMYHKKCIERFLKARGSTKNESCGHGRSEGMQSLYTR